MSYDMIDRYLRNNLHDCDYAEYSAALDAVAEDAARVARIDEARRWAVDELTLLLRATDARYMAPVQSVLGPLPVPFMELNRDVVPVVYEAWANQMRAYATDAVAAERERCASWLAWYDDAKTRRSEAVRNGDHWAVDALPSQVSGSLTA